MRKHKISDINLQIANLECFSNENHEGFIIQWDSNIGFGEYTVYRDINKPEAGWCADSETMDCNEDKEFITELLRLFIKQLHVM